MNKGWFLVFSYLVLMIAGGLWGVREKVHQRPAIFHELFPDKNIEPVSFFGKEMWKMKHQPQSRAIRQILQWIPINDFWHSSHYLIKILYVLGFWMAWRSKGIFWDFTKFWPLLIWFGIITTFWGGFTYWLVGTFVK